MIGKEKVSEKFNLEDLQLLENLTTMEKKLDCMIMTKRLDMQEWLRSPSRMKCKIRVTVSPFFHVPAGFTIPNVTLPATKEAVSGLQNTGTFELKVEGKIVDACLVPDLIGSTHVSNHSALPVVDYTKINKKFASFFKSVFVELDKSVYGQDMCFLEWLRPLKPSESDGFTLKRPIVTLKDFTAIVILSFGFNPPQFRVAPLLSRLLGIDTQTKSQIVRTLWKYITINNLLDSYNRDLVHCNDVLKQIFGCDQFYLVDIPDMLMPLLHPPAQSVLTCHIQNPINSDTSNCPNSSCYGSPPLTFDIETEVDDFIKDVSQSFVIHFGGKVFSIDLAELQALDQQVKQLSDQVVSMKAKLRDYISYIDSPSSFINKWLRAQCFEAHSSSNGVDSKNNHSIEEESCSEFYYRPWSQEFVHRYLFNVIENKSNELYKRIRS